MTKSTNRRLSRRQFLLGAAAALGGLALAEVRRILSLAQGAGNDIYMPYVARDEPEGPIPTATATTPGARTPTPTRTPSSPPPGTPSPTPTSTISTTPSTTPPPGAARVVHIRGANATDWNGSGYFYDHVNQGVVGTMVQTGLAQLTGQSTWASIWGSLFGRVHPGGYTPGQKIAIKASFNNSIVNGNTCSSHNNNIDAVPEIFMALLQGLTAAGVQAADVVIYDASGRQDGSLLGKYLPDYFRNPIAAAYPGVQFVGLAPGCSGVPVITPTYGGDPSQTVTFNDPGGLIQNRVLADVLYNATYLINVPIIKIHGGDDAMPVSLGMKNHYGSINYVYASSPGNSLHEYMELQGGQYYSSNYSPLVDVNAHPLIKNKTALIVGDALFGAAASSTDAVQSWKIFNDAANSLLFSADPVAIDCVMTDMLRIEANQPGTAFWQPINDPRVYDFLFCAQDAGLGVCEGTRADPGGDPLQQPYGSGYSSVDYVRQDI